MDAISIIENVFLIRVKVYNNKREICCSEDLLVASLVKKNRLSKIILLLYYS